MRWLIIFPLLLTLAHAEDALAPHPIYFSGDGSPSVVYIKIKGKVYCVKWDGKNLTLEEDGGGGNKKPPTNTAGGMEDDDDDINEKWKRIRKRLEENEANYGIPEEDAEGRKKAQELYKKIQEEKKKKKWNWDVDGDDYDPPRR
jgi:hypothetical protein